jgi:hypothetical protein
MFDVDPILLQKYRESVNLSFFPKGARKWLDSLDEETKTIWYTERFLCLKYPLYLAGSKTLASGEIVPTLGMDFQVDPHDVLFHQFVQKRPGEGLVLSDLDIETKKRMILWSRGTFKSSAVVVDIVLTILNYPNVRICFLTGGDQLAKRQLARVKRIFERPTDRFKQLFPEFCLKSVRNRKIADEADPRAWSDVQPKMGTAHEFTVPARTKDTFAEPTFAISTAKSVKAGSHFDLIYIDDLVNEQNYRSIKALAKCYQDYIDICPLLEPSGHMLLTGTRYSFGDTYELIQEDARKEEKQLGRTIWKFSIRDCWSMGCKNCAHTDVYHNSDVNILQPPCTVAGCACLGFQPNGAKGVLFPEARTLDGRSIGHTLEWLEAEKIRVGPEFFANQYENKPIATGAQTFTETLVGAQTLHEMAQIPPYGQSTTFVVGDLAYVGQPGRDASVLYVCRLFQGQIFVFDCLDGNWDSGAVAENTVNCLLKHRPNMMYYEKFNGWEAYDRIIAAHASTKGVVKVPLVWEKGSQAANAKLIRIGSVKGVLTAKRLWLYSGMPGYQKLVTQLVKWPKLGRHDDYADCLGMVVSMDSGYHLDNPPQAVNTMNWLRSLHAAHAEPEQDSRPCGSYNDESQFYG